MERCEHQGVWWESLNGEVHLESGGESGTSHSWTLAFLVVRVDAGGAEPHDLSLAVLGRVTLE